MAQFQTQYRALNNLQAPGAPARTGFPQFGRLPQEIQNAIWKEALQTEAQKIVLHDSETGGIYLSQDLVSSIAEVNSAARTIANEFYNVKLDVFACDLEYESLSRPRRHQRGVVRLNLEYATMMFGFDSRDLFHAEGWWKIGMPEDSEALQNKLAIAMTEADPYGAFKEHCHAFGRMGRPCSEDVPGYVTVVHVTSALTISECAQVRRIIQLTEDPRLALWDSICCWNCDARNFGLDGYCICTESFSNVEFCRLLATTRWGDCTGNEYTWDQIVDDCAKLTTAHCWDSIKLRLRPCAKHENPNDQNEGEENNDDEIIDDVNIDNADEDAAGESDVADQRATNGYDAEKSNKDDADKREDKEFKKFAAVCARKEKSFFF